MSNASLGAVAFIAQVSQLLWAVPLALWADRGSRKLVAGVALLVFAGFGALMAISPNVWWFAFLYLAASVGTGVNNTVHNSYLSDAYPTESARAHLQLAQPLRPAVADDRHPHLRFRRDHRPRLALRVARRPRRHPARPRPVHPARAGEGGEREQPHPQGFGHGPAGPAGRGAAGVARFGGDPAACGSGRSISSWWPWPSSDSPERVRRSSAISSSSTSSTWTRPAGARSTPSSAWPPSSGSRWPTSSGTVTSVGPRSGRLSLPASASRPMAASSSSRSTCLSSGCASRSSSWPAPRSRPLAICIFLTLAATAPPEMRTICFAMFGVYSLVFGGFTGSVILGAVSDAIGGLHGIVVALTLIAPVCAIGGFLLDLGVPQRAPRHHSGDRGCDRAVHRGQAPGERRWHPRSPGAQPGLLLRHQSGALRRQRGGGRRGDGGPARDERSRQVHPSPCRVGSGAPPPGRDPPLRHELRPTWSPSRSSTRGWRCWWAGR